MVDRIHEEEREIYHVGFLYLL